jgi:hypothetical protein
VVDGFVAVANPLAAAFVFRRSLDAGGFEWLIASTLDVGDQAVV